jgi:hypothetical protein
LDGYINLEDIAEFHTAIYSNNSNKFYSNYFYRKSALENHWNAFGKYKYSIGGDKEGNSGVFKVPKWLRLALFIEEFEMGAPNQCLENSLELYTGRFGTIPFRRFCGVTATHIYTGEVGTKKYLFFLI